MRGPVQNSAIRLPLRGTISLEFLYLIDFQENCPGGCPCDDYPCAETTTAPVPTSTTPATTTSPTTNAVLVLSTSTGSNKPMVIDWDGEFILENYSMNRNLHIQVITMMISISTMATVQLFTWDVERP